jgi:polyphenol oxidase
MPTHHNPVTHYTTSVLLAPYPVVCVFTGKPLSFGGTVTPRPHVQANRAALCEQLGLNAQALRVPDQVHGNTIKWAHDADLTATDGLITDTRFVPVGCVTADCVPVVLYSPTAHVGAVIHAGWKGTAQGITAKAVKQLCRHYGVPANDLRAVIGPAIGPTAFEAGPEVVAALATQLDPPFFIQQFCMDYGPHGNPKVDVKAVNMAQLTQCGVLHIACMPQCTYTETAQFWSYRRGDAGRQLALLCLQ